MIVRIMPIEIAVRKRENSKPINLNTSFNNLQISQPTTIKEIDTPRRDNNPKRITNPIATNNFMMIPEPREFCFSMFFSFLIILTFFFASSITSVVFCFVGIKRDSAQDWQVFCDKYARPKHEGKRKICRKTTCGSNFTVRNLHVHTFARRTKAIVEQDDINPNVEEL